MRAAAEDRPRATGARRRATGARRRASGARRRATGSRSPATGARRLAVGLTGPVAVAGLIVYLLAGHRYELNQALAHLTLAPLAAVVLLSAVSLLARAEALVQGLCAMPRRPARVEVHAASGLTFVAACLNHYVASPVRAALLRRTASERAPTTAEMFALDGATSIIEALLAAVLILASAGTLRLPWWVAPAAAAGALGGLGLALAARRRVGHWPGIGGLAVLEDARGRLRIGALMAVVFACQIARTLIVLRTVGLHPTALQATATFLAAGVLSALFAGPSAGAAGAPLIVFGHRNLALAGVAGVVLSVTALLAALLYATLGTPLYVGQLLERNRRRPAPPVARAPYASGRG